MTLRIALFLVPAAAISLACNGFSSGPDFTLPAIDLSTGPYTATIGFVDAPPLGITDWLKGDEVDLSTANNVVLVEHWATWCGPCRVEMPHLTDMQQEYGDALTIIGISDEDIGTVRPFVSRNDATMGYTVARSPVEPMLEWTRLSGATGIPYSYLVQAGQVVWHGHPAALMPVLPHVLAGTWTESMAQAYALLPTIPGSYLASVDTIGPDNARPLVDVLLENPTMGADVKNELSWTILTEVRQDQQDLALALTLIQQATDEVHHNSWAYEDTLGLAYFMNGDTPNAIAAQETAVSLCNDAQAGAPCTELAERLASFERGESGMNTP